MLHRNIITEADYFVAHIANKKKTIAKIIQNKMPLLGFSWFE